MRVNHVSSYMIGNHQKPIIAQGQSDLINASYEATMGRVRDPGLTLGYRTGHFLETDNQITLLTSQQNMNNLVAQRMKASQSAMESLIANPGDKEATKGPLQAYLNQLIGDNVVPGAAVKSSRSALDSMISALNTTYNGEYVFGGANKTQPPMEYYKPGSSTGASKAVQDAFDNYFAAHGSPAVEDITPTQMQDFLDSPDFNNLFDTNPPNANGKWNDATTGFSKASSEEAKSYISPNGEIVDVSVSANSKGFRDSMKALVMVAEFGDIGLSDKTMQTLADSSVKVMGNAIKDIGDTQSLLGTSENRVAVANQRIDSQLKVLNQSKNDLIGVDTAEASNRLIAIENMLNISYNLTARISKLSLINYL